MLDSCDILWGGSGDSDGNLVPDECECLADITGSAGVPDGQVNVVDLLAVIAAWGQSGGAADITNDGSVNVADLLELIANWGSCGG